MAKSYNLRRAPLRIVAESEQEANLAKFNKGHANTMDMLKEIGERMPWRRGIVASLTSFVKNKGALTAKQRMFITSMYIDNCAMSNVRVQEQITTRKTVYRLLKLNTLGQVRKFVYDLSYRTDAMPFTPNQIKAIQNIASRAREQLAEIPDLTDTEFDGWFRIEPGVSPPGEEVDVHNLE